jgi:hypothetical protein
LISCREQTITHLDGSAPAERLARAVFVVQRSNTMPTKPKSEAYATAGIHCSAKS